MIYIINKTQIKTKIPIYKIEKIEIQKRKTKITKFALRGSEFTFYPQCNIFNIHQKILHNFFDRYSCLEYKKSSKLFEAVEGHQNEYS